MAVHAVRDDISQAIERARRGEPPPVATLERINEAQRNAPVVRELAWDGASVTAVPRRQGPPGSQLVAHLAGAAAELLADPAVTTVRVCEAEDCVMLFLPLLPAAAGAQPRAAATGLASPVTTTATNGTDTVLTRTFPPQR